MPDTPAPRASAADFETLADAVRETAYVAVGFAVLGFQRAQVLRVELTRAIDERFQPARNQVEEQAGRLEQYLPAGARDVVQSIRAAASAPEQIWRSAV
ncbi:MAG: hypothetical protein ACRDYY_03935, partial [Acidimicrobiales bacterium]